MTAAATAWARMAATAALVLAADQATKALAAGSLHPGERVALPLGVELVDVRNRGIAFGLLGDGGWAVAAIAAASLLAIVAWFAVRPTRPWLWLGIGLLLGGAAGNLLDRVREGAVTDFLDPPAWPAFNLADVAITLGVAAIAFSVFAESDSGGRERASPGPGR